MQIQITANLTDEKALILAKEKGYQENVTIQVPSVEQKEIINVMTGLPELIPVSYSQQEIPNPETAGEFLKRVYENMIIEEVTTNFIRITDRDNIPLRQEEEKAIRDEVIASITSNVL